MAAELRYRFQLQIPGISPPIFRPLQLWKRTLQESFISLSSTSPSHSQVHGQKEEEDSPNMLGSTKIIQIQDFEDQERSMLEALRRRKTEEAWRIFQGIRKSKRGMPGKECVSRLIAQLCLKGEGTSVRKAQELISEIQGMDQISNFVDDDAMGLVVMASTRNGAARYSCSILRNMIRKWGMRPSVKIWSAVVAKLSKNEEDGRLALEIFDEICAMLPLPRNKEFEKMYPDCGAFNAALNACASCGEFGRARDVWTSDMVRFRVSPDILSFNVLIKVYARAKRLDLVESVLKNMNCSGVMPNLATFNSLVAAFVGAGEIDRAERVIRTLRNEELDESEKFGGKTGEFENLKTGDGEFEQDGGKLKTGDVLEDPFLEELEKFRGKFTPDVRMFTTLMKGYVQQGRASDALQLLVAMQKSSSSSSLQITDSSSISSNFPAAAAPNEFTFTTAIRACTKMGLMREAQAILCEMSKAKIPANSVTYNTLLQGLCSIPDMNAASEVIQDMNTAGISPDVVTFNTLISGHLRAEDASTAMEIFSKMRESGIHPSRITYGTLMSAFARAGHPDLSARIFSEMAGDSRVGVDLVACNILIDAYARSGMEAAASEAFLDMKSWGFLPNNATYTSLVKAYSTSKNHGELLLLWKEILHRSMDQQRSVHRDRSSAETMLRFRPDEALLDSLIDAFVRGAFFHKALQVVECMEEQGIEANRARAKYKRLYVELYANLYTSPYRSQSRRARTAVRRRAVEAFKFWVGLPNTLYGGDWRIRDDDQEEERTFRDPY